MNLSRFAVIWTVLYLVFGLGLLLVPNAFMAAYGVSFDDSGMMMSRILGAALTANGLLFWMNRHLPLPDTAWKNILVAGTIYSLIDIPIVLLATLNGVMNDMGGMPVILHIFLAGSQGYFAFRKS
ncbi:MAG: hypothetical protein IPJ06_03745 [Saprospiraceae bacterium]|nr:hypothetical protein [Saprospiraceae bacterium]